MAFFNAHIGKWSAFLAGLWLWMLPGWGVFLGASESGQAAAVSSEVAPAAAVVPAEEGSAAVARLQAELPERKFPGFDAILQKALVNGPSIIMREWDAAAAAEDSRGARAPMLPSLNATVNTGVTYEQRRAPSGSYDRTFTAVLYSVGFYQPVYHWGALSDNYKIGQIRRAMAERNIAETRRVLAIDVRRRYFDVILAANGLRLARENMTRLEEDKKSLEQLIADGARAPAEIDGANRALDIARPGLEQAENQFAALRLSMAQIAGAPDAEFGDLPDAIPAPGDISDALAALSAGVSAPPSAQLQNVYDGISIEKLSFDINKTRQLPKLGFSASVVQQPDNSNVHEKSLLTGWNAAFSVNWNIFDGFASQAAKRASLNRLRALEIQRGQAEQQESSGRRAEVSRLLVQWRQLQNDERDLDRARGGRDLAEQDFAAGMTSQRAVDDARNGLAHALQNIYAARASFYTELASCLSNRGQDPAVQNNGGPGAR
ncbi:MAG: TolC family protein [Opitutaceae bacterium]|jgi:outer membrane protein TolC|nr:TolC family protein [Opitutaceae bacterium]